MNKYQKVIDTMNAQDKQIWTRELWHKAMDENTLAKFPTTVEQVEWQDEWYELNPKEKAAMEGTLAEGDKRRANEYMVFKILLRSFLENADRGIFILNWDNETKTCRVINVFNRDKEFEIKL